MAVQVVRVDEQGVTARIAREDEAAEPADGPVRDSKDPSGPALLFPADAWPSFVAAVHAGEFGSI
ncbi:DUF397 domain-containing protein [Kitasatospora sp. NPDC091207]|uniref:DUF397 domain-containing protein n=1 Tax=Kitasatospora sp. NPDC091207 TaxID=3364083 RepID=UPI00382D38AF